MMEALSPNDALAVLERCPFAWVIRDAEGHITAFNKAFATLVGPELATALSNLDSRALHKHEASRLFTESKSIRWAGDQKQDYYLQPYDIELPGSDRLRARFFADVSPQVHLEHINHQFSEELEKQVLTDSVTGLLNRRGLVLALEPQVARSRRYNSPISVIALQVESASRHDELLIEIARLLKDQLRWADLIGTSANHIFTLVLPETTEQAATNLAAKLKRQVDDLIHRRLGTEQVVCHHGVTAWGRNDNTTSLLNRAEIALDQTRLQHSEHSVAL